MRDYQGKRGEYDRPQGRRESVRNPSSRADLPCRPPTRSHARPYAPTLAHAHSRRTHAHLLLRRALLLGLGELVRRLDRDELARGHGRLDGGLEKVLLEGRGRVGGLNVLIGGGGEGEGEEACMRQSE